MSVARALSSIEQIMVARTGPMGKIICQREIGAIGKKTENFSQEDVETYIGRLVKAITPVLGQMKAQELAKEINTTALSILYGGKASGAGQAEEGSFKVVQAFFILSDGRPLAHTAASADENQDKEILSSMLTAVQGFMADSLGRGESGALDELKYGNTTLLMSRKGNITMVVVVSGHHFAPVRHYMGQALDEVVELYTPILENWDGDQGVIKGIKYYTDVICLSGPVMLVEGGEPEVSVPEPEPARASERKSAPEPAADEDATGSAKSVELVREIEFYGGYIRIKVGVKNHMPTVITNAALKLSYNDTALRFERLDPPVDMHGSEMMIGNIGSFEKKSFSIYLDPVICMDSFIDGVLTFRDAKGSLETLKMKRKLVSIVCPMLYTDQEINTAMLKRLVNDQLNHQDNRYFKFDRTDWETALGVLKKALGKHDIKLVREIHWDKEPKMVEVWYYAQVKGRKDHLVVRATVWKDKKVFVLFVASESLLIVTGFLAEMRHDIAKEMERSNLMPGTFFPMLESEATNVVGRHTPLIMKVSDSEIEPEGTEVR